VQDASRDIRNISLIGFMGVGKSTVGKMVAGQLAFQFVDTDAWIEKRAGKPISQIFSEDGEAHFRGLEAEVVVELGRGSRQVIATGGGMAANEVHFESLKRHSVVFWLWASEEAIWQRVRHHAHRPLLQTPDPRARIRELLAAREPVYRQADVLLNTELRQPRDLAQLVIGHFRSLSRPGAA